MFESTATYWLTRLLFQRALAAVYLIGFIAVLHQWKPLLGERGLLPVPQFVKAANFWDTPSIFHWMPKDSAFMFFGWLGAVLALAALTGLTERFGNGVSMAAWGVLWALMLSYVNVGQTFYAFGWESLLVETGFYAIFLGSANSTPSLWTIFLLRWLLFRVMFGAGLIKLRGDPCWRDLTCMNYHYETQPLAGPLSWYFHLLPVWWNKLSVIGNHIVELAVPFLFFLRQPFAAIGGFVTILFHGWLFASGNFAFLGFLTMVLSIPTLPDSWLRYIIPLEPGPLAALSPPMFYTVYAVVALVGALSILPIVNMLSSRQAMNASFNPFHLVGTYGAFGSITKTRYEVVIEGTADSTLTPETRWQEYEFIAKPGRVKLRPPQIAPYHLRLDWLMWFLPFRAEVVDKPESPTGKSIMVYGYEPWFVHFMEKLLVNDKGTLSLMRKSPFQDAPPKYVRAQFYRYRFTTPNERSETGAWWHRELVGTYFPPVSLDTPEFRNMLQSRGWLEDLEHVPKPGFPSREKQVRR